MKIAFCSSEVVPFAKTGGLADVCGTLPLALKKLGQEIIVILPYYKVIDDEKFDLKPLGRGVFTTTIGHNIQVYFIENDKFFGRDELYGDKHGDYKDNLQRFSFFCRRALEILKEFDLQVNIVHCHDWQTALIPIYLKTNLKDDPFYKKIKSILTIHNMAYQGVFSKNEFSVLGLNKDLFSIHGLEFYDQVNLLKGGIIFSDVVTTVSPTYAKEIQTKEFGCGLEGVLRHRKKKVVGILNGLDYDAWNPAIDPLIAVNYTAQSPNKKLANKETLQKTLGLAIDKDTAVFGFVGRMTHQKGVDLILESIEELMSFDIQLALLGIGEQKYMEALKQVSRRYPTKVAVHLQFNEPLAHQIYAGSDFFLMPSVFEPCGLSQMIALRYGTIPIVYKVGGLADTITSYKDGGHGFIFSKYTADDFIKVVKEAIKVFHQREKFLELVARAFACNFSWEQSARHYVDLFKETVGHG